MTPPKRPGPASGIPPDAIIAGADSSLVAWQPAFCTTSCPLHLTSLRGGLRTEIGLPPDTALDPGDTPDFDPGGQRLALPLDAVDQQGAATSTSVYVADLRTHTLARVPGPPVPVATLPRPVRARSRRVLPTSSPRAGRPGGAGLWMVATGRALLPGRLLDGPPGPLHVLRPQAGLGYKFGLPGAPGS